MHKNILFNITLTLKAKTPKDLFDICSALGREFENDKMKRLAMQSYEKNITILKDIEIEIPYNLDIIETCRLLTKLCDNTVIKFHWMNVNKRYDAGELTVYNGDIEIRYTKIDYVTWGEKLPDIFKTGGKLKLKK